MFRNVQVKERYAELMAPAIEATEATVERVLIATGRRGAGPKRRPRSSNTGYTSRATRDSM